MELIYSWLVQKFDPITVVALMLSAWLIYRFWLKPFTLLITKTTADLERVAKTLADDKGNPLVSFSVLADVKEQVSLLKDDFEEHADKADAHYSDLQHVASSEHWKTCDVNKCAHMQQIFNKLDKSGERFDSFDKRAEETRGNTNLSLQDIREGQKDLGRELADLAKSIIGLLSNSLKEKDK